VTAAAQKKNNRESGWIVLRDKPYRH